MDLFGESALGATIAIAQSLTSRAGLPPDLAAVVALVDAIERGQWGAGTLATALGELADHDRVAIAAAIETLIGAGVVVETGGSHALAPEVRALLARRGDATAGAPTAKFAELGGLVAPHAAVVVVIVEEPERALAELAEGLGRSVAIVSDRARLEDIRDAWLRDDVVAVAPVERLWISPVAKVPVRVIACLAPGSAGETIALLRRNRRVAIWRPPVARGARIAPPDYLAPLVYTMWNGLRTPTPAIRIATLRGSTSEIQRAAAAVAAAHGLPLRHASGRDFAAVRDAVATSDTVVLVDELAELSPLPAAALAAVLTQTTSIILLVGDDLPGPLAAISRAIELPSNG